MDVSQIINLAEWYRSNVPPVTKIYSQLQQKLQHNAQQAQKQPLRDDLENLLTALGEISFERLTNEELDLLHKHEVLQFLGYHGQKFVNSTVSTSEFDPVSAAADMNKALGNLNNALNRLNSVQTALSELQLDLHEIDEQYSDFPLVRVRFKENASLNDVVSLKKWIADWYDITRGAALSVGETPEAVRVVGANNGSVIITLASVATVTTVLAIIAKNAGRIVGEGLSIANDIEDLRHKKRLNKVIEDELKKQQAEIKENGVADTIAELKSSLPNLVSKSIDNELKKSVEKYFKFYESGGDVDFIPPRVEATESDDDSDVALLETIAQHSDENQLLSNAISDFRKTLAGVKRIMDYSNSDESES